MAPSNSPENASPAATRSPLLREDQRRKLAAAGRAARTWAWVLIPLVATWELAAHYWIVSHVPTAAQWRAAGEYIARERRPDDVVASAPLWTDPLARMYFAPLISLRDAARPDATRYARAFVATIRGAQHVDFRGWTEEHAERFGEVTVRVLRNPHRANVLYDFVEHLAPPDASVVRATSGDDPPCAYRTGLRVEGGGLGQGALAGPARFMCGEPWNYVGRVVIEDMDHRGRLCIWSHPVVGAAMRTTYHDVPVGTVLRGHHALAYEAERGGDHYETGAPITLRVLVGGREIGRDVHTDGEGWKLFQFDTRDLAGTRQDVAFEVTVPSGGNRHYCFEADTR